MPTACATRMSSSATRRALDAVGDLALAGLPLLATYRSLRGGHTLNHAILSALMVDPSAWAVVEATSPVVAPPRRVRGHAEVATTRSGLRSGRFLIHNSCGSRHIPG